MSSFVPKRVVAPHPRSLDEVLGRNLPQWAVDFVVIDLERDLERGIFLTLKLASVHPSKHVRRMYFSAIEFFKRLDFLMSRGDSISLKLAHRMLLFPEPYEIRLGYTAFGSYGSALGAGELREHLFDVLRAQPQLRQALTVEPDIIQSVPWIAMDRSSDIVATITKDHLIAFTQEQAEFWKFDSRAMKNTTIYNCWDGKSERLTKRTDLVPVDDLGRPFLLVPKEICRSGPAITPQQYFRDLGPKGGSPGKSGTLKEQMLKNAESNPGRLAEWAADRLRDPSRIKPRKEFRNTKPLK